jgi:hypothetical protein
VETLEQAVAAAQANSEDPGTPCAPGCFCNLSANERRISLTGAGWRIGGL